jgi:hypothetical protein
MLLWDLHTGTSFHCCFRAEMIVLARATVRQSEIERGDQAKMKEKNVRERPTPGVCVCVCVCVCVWWSKSKTNENSVEKVRATRIPSKNL